MTLNSKWASALAGIESHLTFPKTLLSSNLPHTTQDFQDSTPSLPTYQPPYNQYPYPSPQATIRLVSITVDTWFYLLSKSTHVESTTMHPCVRLLSRNKMF